MVIKLVGFLEFSFIKGVVSATSLFLFTSGGAITD